MVLGVLALLVAGCGKTEAPNQQMTFTTPEEAVTAFVAAARSGSDSLLEAMLGAGSSKIVVSSDTISDQIERSRFVARYDEKHALVDDGLDTLTLNVGRDDWPLPIPLVKSAGRWHWDGAAGQEEVFFRRIGHNELNAIAVSRSILGAQQEYAAAPHDGHKAGPYARHLVSEAGTHDGLYWPTKDGEARSPAGPLLAQGASEGYGATGVRVPYHGYYYHMLESGAGFGFLAYPADYHESGIMTFQVSETGVVYQKDLGDATDSLAQAMTVYQVDSTWAEVKAEE